MREHDLELSDFTEPFGPRYSCALSYTDLDGWAGLCACPLCNAEHPEHEHAVRRACAYLN
jgi:hypothetical protein